MAMGGTIDAWLSGLATARPTGARPLVTLTYAQSLDGSIAAEKGRGLAISGPESMQLTHRLRAAHGARGAILVGIGTVLSDDPRLTVRLAEGENPQPVVLDSRLRMPIHCRLMQREDKKPVIFTAEGADPDRRQALEAAGARVISLPSRPSGLDLGAVLDSLGVLGFATLMVEGGASVIGSFLRGGCYDWAMVTIAPVWVGGVPVDVRTPGQRGFPALKDPVVEQYGRDAVVLGRRGWWAPEESA